MSTQGSRQAAPKAEIRNNILFCNIFLPMYCIARYYNGNTLYCSFQQCQCIVLLRLTISIYGIDK